MEKKFDKWDYIQFPHYLVPELLADVKITTKRIFIYGIYHHTKSEEFDEINDLNKKLDMVKKMLSVENINNEEVIEMATLLESDSRYNGFCSMVKITKVIEFNEYKKNEKELFQLMGYICIQSMIGKKPWKKMYSTTFVNRMCGWVSEDEVPEEICGVENYIRQKLNTPDKVNRLFKGLAGWGVYKTCPRGWGIRGFYATVRGKISYEKLDRIAIERSPGYKKLKRKKEQQRRIKEIEDELLRDL